MQEFMDRFVILLDTIYLMLLSIFTVTNWLFLYSLDNRKESNASGKWKQLTNNIDNMSILHHLKWCSIATYQKRGQFGDFCALELNDRYNISLCYFALKADNTFCVIFNRYNFHPLQITNNFCEFSSFTSWSLKNKRRNIYWLN